MILVLRLEYSCLWWEARPRWSLCSSNLVFVSQLIGESPVINGDGNYSGLPILMTLYDKFIGITSTDEKAIIQCIT